MAKLGKDWPLQDTLRVPIPFFKIIPSIAHGTPIMIQRPRPGAPTGYWDDPVTTVKAGHVALDFMSYFDWNPMDYIDLQYYRVKITKFDPHPELVGRDALIERKHAGVRLL